MPDVKLDPSHLYQPCSLCHGTLVTVVNAMVDGYRGFKADARMPAYSGRLGKGNPCPCVDSPLPGWQDTGITMSQAEKAQEKFSRLLLALADNLDAGNRDYAVWIGGLLEPYRARIDHMRVLRDNCAVRATGAAGEGKGVPGG